MTQLKPRIKYAVSQALVLIYNTKLAHLFANYLELHKFQVIYTYKYCSYVFFSCRPYP